MALIPAVAIALDPGKYMPDAVPSWAGRFASPPFPRRSSSRTRARTAQAGQERA